MLLSKRHQDAHQGGLWEFPGGKLEVGESVEQALAREVHEELGLRVKLAQALMKVEHNYSDKSVLLDVWLVTDFDGEPSGREGQAVRWYPLASLAELDFPDANYAIVNHLLKDEQAPS